MAYTSGNDLNILQATDNAVVGAGAGNDKYILSGNQLSANQVITISDANGSNTLQLLGGLTISSSKVASNAIQLTLSNGAIVNVLGADTFMFEIGGNPLSGQSGTIKTFAQFVNNTLGVIVPTGGQISDGTESITVNNDGSTTGALTPIVLIPGTTAPVTATSAPDVFSFDVAAAKAIAANTQIPISNFDVAHDKLQIKTTTALGDITLAALNGVDGITVQANLITNSTIINFGADANGDVIAITLTNIIDPSLVHVSGVSSNPTQTDTTPPILSSTLPSANSITVDPSSDLVLTFSEQVKAGSGNFIIFNSDGTVAQTIAVNDSSQVSISGNTVTINPSSDLVAGNSYYVNMASGVIKDLAGNSFAGLSGTTVFNFTTAKINNTFIGSAGSDYLSGSAGDDVINGLAGSDTLDGGDGNDTLNGGAGDDVLYGGKGVDTASYANAAGAVTVNLAGLYNGKSPTGYNASGADGNDKLYSIENLVGGAYNDILTGDSSNNVLNGGEGNDTLYGGKGNDSLYGGKGADTFSFGSGEGNDTIYDFNSSEDKIVIVSGTNGITSPTQVMTHLSSGASGGTVLDLGNGNTVNIIGVSPASFSSSMFIVGSSTTPTTSSAIFSITADAASVNEGNNATFTINLSAAQTTATTVNYTLEGTGGTILGVDTSLVSVSGGIVSGASITFPAGVTEVKITVPIILDNIVETGKGISITLSSPSAGSALGTATASTLTPDNSVTSTTLASKAAAFNNVQSGTGTIAKLTDAYMNTLDSGWHWNKTAITYDFNPQIPSDYLANASLISNWHAFNALEASVAQAGLQRVSDLTPLTFTQVGGTTGDIRFNMADMSDANGFGYYPGNGLGGDIWINNTNRNETNAYQPGSYGVTTIIHEIGHALGLKHTFGSPNILPANLDDSAHSVMSYTHYKYLTPSFTYSDTQVSCNYVSCFQTEYSLFDVEALQAIYGANTSYHTGADTYTVGANQYRTLWDAGGTDTIDESSATGACTVNLCSGQYSSVNVQTLAQQQAATLAYYHAAGKIGAWVDDWVANIYGGTSASSFYTGENNLAIAPGVWIENVNTGSANDTVVDNAVNNTINTGAGNDLIQLYWGGYDTVNGGSGTDIVQVLDKQSQDSIVKQADGSYLIVGTYFSAVLIGVEQVQFSDLFQTLTA